MAIATRSRFSQDRAVCAPDARGDHPRAAGVAVSGYRLVVENPPTPAQAAAMVAGAVDVLAALLRASDGDAGEEE